MFEFSLHQLAAVKTLSVYPACPVPGGKKAHQVEFTGFHSFQSGGVVFVNFDRHTVKIGRSFAHVKVFGPVTRVAHIGNVFAKFDGPDLVRSAANRVVHHYLVE